MTDQQPTVRVTAGRPVIDLTGNKYGRLTVLSRAKANDHGGKPRWFCLCDCGTSINVPGHRLRTGSNKSCGCLRKDRMGEMFRKHGKSKTPEYVMFYDARKRAARFSLPFDITPEDIQIPLECPVLGIPLRTGGRDNAPSLDRIKPKEGYVRGNIEVISFRANRLKSDASTEEMRAVLNYMEAHNV